MEKRSSGQTPPQFPERRLWRGGGQPLLPGNSDRTRADDLMFHHGSDWLLVKNSSLKEWLGIGTAAQGVVESPSMEAFIKKIDVALRDTVSGHSGDGMMVVLDDPSGPFQPQ